MITCNIIKIRKREKHTIIYIDSFVTTNYIQFLTNKSSSTKQTNIDKYTKVLFGPVYGLTH